MRAIQGVVACAAIMAGSGVIHADGIGSLLAGAPAGRPDAPMLAPLPGPASFSGNPFAPPVPRTNGIRLAQSEKPYSSGNPSLAPLKWVGMLINPTPTKQSPRAVVECTAQFIKPNVVLTAAHCVKDVTEDPTGPWYDLTKQYFVLQFQNGEGSRTFKTVCAATNPLWKVPDNYKSLSEEEQNKAFLAAAQHDYAMILVNGTSPTGVMPYKLDWKGNYSGATRVGYAANILDGKIIQQSHGVVFFADDIPMFKPADVPNLVVHWQRVIGLTSGTSGGAWIANFSTEEADDKNALIAVTSFSNATFPGAEMGADLRAAEFNPLLDYVSKGCGGQAPKTPEPEQVRQPVNPRQPQTPRAPESPRASPDDPGRGRK
jgi:hypothetical protein